MQFSRVSLWIALAASGGTAQQTQNICITFIPRRPNVEDVGPTLYKYYTTVLCLLGGLLLFTTSSVIKVVLYNT